MRDARTGGNTTPQLISEHGAGQQANKKPPARPFHAAALKAPKAQRGAALALADKQHRVQQVVDSYAQNPRQSAQKLRQLGMSGDFIRAVHKSSVPHLKTEPPKGASLLGGLSHGFTGVKAVDKTLGGLADTALYAGPGAVLAARGVGQDVGAATHGNFSFKRSRQIGSALVHAAPDDIRRARHGDLSGLILDASAALTAGGSLVARGAATGRALEEGAAVGRALTRKTSEGGSLLHAPPPGVAELKVGGATVRKPLSRNPVYRNVVQKPRYKLAQRRLNEGAPPVKATGGPAKFGEKHGPESLVGKEIAHQRRLDQAHAHGEFEHARRMTKRLSRGEHAAMRVVAIEGNKALKSSDAVIARHIATHERFISEGQDVAAHTAAIRDLGLARKVLSNPSSRFTAALNATRDLANHGEGESIARSFLTKDAAQARKQKIADVYGGKADPGSFYFHAGHALPDKKGARFYNPRPGPTGIGKPTPSRYAPELRREFTGRGIAKGHVPTNIPQAVMQAYARRIHLHSAHDLYSTLRHASTDARENLHQIPIRDTTSISGDLKRLLGKVEANIHASPDELHSLTRDEITRLEEEMKAAEHAHAVVGSKIKGVRWVDERFVKDLGLNSDRGGLARVADAITNPTRFASLYLRPAYALNLAGNAAMLAPEGPAAIRAVGRAARATSRHGGRNTALIDARMGSGKALGQTVDTGFGRRSVQALAQGWNNATDLHLRRAAFELEAERAGFKSPQAMNSLLHDAAHRNKLDEVTRRSRGIMGDYEDLTPFERNAVRRIIYFYPWTKVAFRWTGRLVREHPIEAAALAALSHSESAHAKKILGLLPQWARLTGFVPVGRKVKGIVNTINPSSINTPSTVVQTAGSGANAIRASIGLRQKGTSGLGDLLTPAGEAFVTAGGQADNSKRTGIIGSLESTPLPSAARRLGIYGKPSKTFPDTGVGPAAGPLAVGGLFPRKTDVSQLNKAGEKELRATLSPNAMAAHDFKNWQGEWKAAIQKHYGHSEIPDVIQKRMNLWHERFATRRRAANGSKLDTRAGIAADIDVVAKHGWVTKAEAANFKSHLADIPDAKLGSITSWLTHTYFDRDGLLSGAAKHLGVQKLRLP